MAHKASQLLLQEAHTARNAGRERDGGNTPFKRRQSFCSLLTHSLPHPNTDQPAHSAFSLSPLSATPKEQRQQGILYLPLSLAPPSSRHQTLHLLCPVLPPLPVAAEGFSLTTLTQQCFPGILLGTSVHQGPPWLPPAAHISKDIHISIYQSGQNHFDCQTLYHPDIHRAAEGCGTACLPLQSDDPITGIFIPCSLVSQML